MKKIRGYLALLLATGCGSLGGPAASDDLPNAGVAGWHPLPQRSGTTIREPFVLCATVGEYHAPSVVELADGSWRMWFRGAGGSLVRATSDDGLYDWGGESVVALPDAGPWQSAGVALDGAGFRMAAARADASGIAFFRSVDGTTWTADGELLPAEVWESGALADPELFHDPVTDAWVLYYAGGGGIGIGRAEEQAGAWVRGPLPLFDVAAVKATSGWPLLSVGEPSGGIDTSRPGPPVYKLWFSGVELHGAFPPAFERSMGFAGSFDGATWVAYDENPVYARALIEAPGALPQFEDERGPSVVVVGAEYRMYYEQTFDDVTTGTSRPCIAVAVTP